MKKIQYIDLFCGIGGFRLALEQACQEKQIYPECVFSSDIDSDAQKAYEANFREKPYGDISTIAGAQIPDHDLLMAGFPCQPFSICGDMNGFEDIRGTLFFDIVRILREKKPKAFILENVKQLKGHQRGKTFTRIMEALCELGYHTQSEILNALDFGLPQKRERIFIVGFSEPILFNWPQAAVPMLSLSKILESDVSDFYQASERIRLNRMQSATKSKTLISPSIWHENKSGNIGVHPYSCALRAGASYNYLLVDGKRRLTEREMMRLQGFPDSYKIVCNYQATRKQLGNSISVPVAAAVIDAMIDAIDRYHIQTKKPCSGYFS